MALIKPIIFSDNFETQDSVNSTEITGLIDTSIISLSNTQNIITANTDELMIINEINTQGQNSSIPSRH